MQPCDRSSAANQPEELPAASEYRQAAAANTYDLAGKTEVLTSSGTGRDPGGNLELRLEVREEAPQA